MDEAFSPRPTHFVEFSWADVESGQLHSNPIRQSELRYRFQKDISIRLYRIRFAHCKVDARSSFPPGPEDEPSVDDYFTGSEQIQNQG